MIQVLDDDSCEMVRIVHNEKVIFEGNYWDLPQSPEGVASLLKKLNLEAVLGTYRYE